MQQNHYAMVNKGKKISKGNSNGQRSRLVTVKGCICKHITHISRQFPSVREENHYTEKGNYQQTL